MKQSRDNSLVAELIKRVIAEFCGAYIPPEEIQQQFVNELSEYNFTQAQWNHVFSALKARWQNTGFPPMMIIRAAISDVQAPERYNAASRMGMMHFRRNGYTYQQRIRLERQSDGGEYWAVAGMSGRKGGETVVLTPKIGMEGRLRNRRST